ncbi:hypothetical protein BJY52DRAFT_174280 [Lactarius psammicola]|nr:hypothetical protein BJY52DRAFT_174280 [Lactarius psammicola]
MTSSPARSSEKGKGSSSKSTSPPTYTPTTPESSSNIERVLLGSPNSSYLWIQYISLQLQLSEIDKTREIAKRALSTINSHEEAEKLNVWIALMTLGNVYSTEECLQGCRVALRTKNCYLRLASILESAGITRTQKNSSNGHAKHSGKASKSRRCSTNTI